MKLQQFEDFSPSADSLRNGDSLVALDSSLYSRNDVLACNTCNKGKHSRESTRIENVSDSMNAQLQQLDSAPHIIILLDVSSSMSKFLSSQGATVEEEMVCDMRALMSAIPKDVLNEVRVVGQVVKDGNVVFRDDIAPCEQTDVLVPFTANDWDLVIDKVKDIQPGGVTPLYPGLLKAVEDAEKVKAKNCLFIYATDGENSRTCGDDFCEKIKQLRKKHPGWHFLDLSEMVHGSVVGKQNTDEASTEPNLYMNMSKNAIEFRESLKCGAGDDFAEPTTIEELHAHIKKFVDTSNAEEKVYGKLFNPKDKNEVDTDLHGELIQPAVEGDVELDESKSNGRVYGKLLDGNTSNDK